MSEETISEDDPGVQAVEAALRTLGEHFDSAHIVCSRKDHDKNGGVTDIISRGSGNYCARYGSLKETVIKMEASIRWKMRRSLNEEE